MPYPSHFFGKTLEEIALHAFNIAVWSTMALIPARAGRDGISSVTKQPCLALKDEKISVYTFFIQMVGNDEARANKLSWVALIAGLILAELTGKKKLPAEAKDILERLVARKITTLADIKIYLDKKIIAQPQPTTPRSKL